MSLVQSHKDLVVWQKAIHFAVVLYTLTNKFPKEELYGLTSQLRRAAISIASNIAEGRQRGATKDYIRFLRIALGSTAEIETQLYIAQKLSLAPDKDFSTPEALLAEITKMLKAMIRQLALKIPNS